MKGSTIKHSNNILFVGPYPPQFGGISSHLQHLLPDLNEAGYNVLSLSPASFDKELRTGQVEHLFFDVKKFFLKRIFIIFTDCFKYRKQKGNLSWNEYLFCISLLRKIILINKKKPIKHIFLYTWRMGFAAPLIKLLFGNEIKIHTFLFGGIYEYPEKYRRLTKNVQDTCSASQTLLASSRYCALSLKKELHIDNKVNVIYIGVDTGLYKPGLSPEPIRTKYGLKEDDILILFFGRMNAEMGLDFLLSNIDFILEKYPKAYFLIAGAKRDLSPLAFEYSQMHEKVFYWENVPTEDKHYTFAAADIVVAPTKDKHACMGVSIKEAMALGIPVIGSSSGGIPEAIGESDETGFIVNISDGLVNRSEFLEKLSMLVEDRELRNKVGNNARQKAEKVFSTHGALEKYKRVIEDLD